MEKEKGVGHSGTKESVVGILQTHLRQTAGLSATADPHQCCLELAMMSIRTVSTICIAQPHPQHAP